MCAVLHNSNKVKYNNVNYKKYNYFQKFCFTMILDNVKIFKLFEIMNVDT